MPRNAWWHQQVVFFFFFNHYHYYYYCEMTSRTKNCCSCSQMREIDISPLESWFQMEDARPRMHQVSVTCWQSWYVVMNTGRQGCSFCSATVNQTPQSSHDLLLWIVLSPVSKLKLTMNQHTVSAHINHFKCREDSCFFCSLFFLKLSFTSNVHDDKYHLGKLWCFFSICHFTFKWQ